MKKTLSLFILLFVTTILFAQVSKTVTCTAGALSSILNGEDEKYFTIVNYNDSADLFFDFEKIKFLLKENIDHKYLIVAPEFDGKQDYGKPNLPFKSYTLSLLSSNKKAKVRYEIIKLDINDIGTNIEIPPVLPEARKYEDPNDSLTTHGVREEKNELIYSNDSFYPTKPITVKTMLLPNNEIKILVEIQPFIYNPVKRIVKHIKQAQIRLYFTDNDVIGEQERNTSFAIDFKKESLIKMQKGLTSLESDSGYVIITTNDFVANSGKLSDFINHKRAQGYSVHVITEDQFGTMSGQEPNGTSEKIREWLIQNRESHRIKYVLLIGDPTPETGDIPMKMLYPRAGTTYYWYDYDCPSDMIYSNLSGNWDLDNDGLFGEQQNVASAVTPDPQISSDSFSIRWTGKINIPDSSGARIAAFFDDGCRIWIDDSLVIDNWQNNLSGTANYDFFSPGLYDIRIEYFQNQQNAFFHLFKGAIGASWFSSFYPNDLFYWDNDSLVAGGLTGTYYNDINLTDSVFSRNDPVEGQYEFRFKWMSGDNGEGGVDFTPDIFVGRIPVYNDNFAETDSILSKTINYENSTDTLWRKNVLLPMKPFDSSTLNYQLGEQIRDSLCLPNNYSAYRIYDEEYGCNPLPEKYPCTNENVIEAWEQPFGLTTWATHGGSNSASSILSSNDCDQLNNNFPSIVVQGSCNNGYPEFGDNLGFALLKKGAIATISASRVSWYGIGTTTVFDGNRYIQGICYFSSKNILERNSIGQSLNMVKDIDASIADNFYWMNFFDYNLYGDPSISLLAKKSFTNPDIPLKLLLSNLTITSDKDTCFNAYDTITVAGDGSLVEFHDGSSVELIAGNTIRFLPGFHALEGSVAHAWITTNGTFCDGASGAIVENPQPAKSGDEGIILPTGDTKAGGMELKVYPNPNSGRFSIELLKVKVKAEVKVYNALGELVYGVEMQDGQSTIDLTGVRRGLYVVVVNDGKERVSKKVMVE